MWRFADIFAVKRMFCGVGYKEPGLLMCGLTICEEDRGNYLLRRGVEFLVLAIKSLLF